jgi:hypothetical protein
MIDAEVLALLFLLIIYAFVGIIMGNLAYKKICKTDGVLSKYHIYTEDDKEYLFLSRDEIAICIGVLWVYYLAFSIWAEVGRDFYDEIIIKNNEEDRIAAWVV